MGRKSGWQTEHGEERRPLWQFTERMSSQGRAGSQERGLSSWVAEDAGMAVWVARLRARHTCGSPGSARTATLEHRRPG